MTETEKPRGLVARTQTEAAQTLTCSTRTLQRWLADGCPGSPKHYPLAEIILWARENIWTDESESLDGVDATLKDELVRQRIERLKRETILQDFKIAERNERLVDAAEVQAMLRHHSGLMRSALEKLERKHGKDALDIVLEVLDELDTIDFDQIGKEFSK